MKKRIGMMVVLFTLGVVPILVLLSRSRKQEFVRDTFVRNGPPPLQPEAEILLPQPFRKIERSVTTSCLYLTHPADPGVLGELCLHQSPTRIRLLTPTPGLPPVMASTLLYPYWFGVSRAGIICRFDFNRGLLDTLGVTTLPIDKIVAANKKSVVLVGVDASRRSFVLGRASDTVQWFPELLGPQEGIFSLDGHLTFNPTTNTFFYLFFYRNPVIAFDTAMRIHYRSRTIDSVSVFGLRVISDKHQDIYTLASPHRVTNALVDSDDHDLVIQSRVLGSGETNSVMRSHFVFDFYNSATGCYRMSFRIPKAGASTVRSFRITPGFLVLLLEDRVRIYKLPDGPNVYTHEPV